MHTQQDGGRDRRSKKSYSLSPDVYVQGNCPTVQNQVGDGAPGQPSGQGSGWQLPNLFNQFLAEICLLQVKPRGRCRAEGVGWVTPPFSASDMGCGQEILVPRFIWDSSLAPWILEQ